MNIKQNHNYQTKLSKSKSKNHVQKHFKVSLKSSTKYSSFSEHSKQKDNLKSSKNQTKIFNQTKSPPCLKRQNTQNSLQNQIISKKSVQSPQLPTKNRFKQNNNKKRLLQDKKLNSDQESTNLYLYNKQSADQQQDPYKISTSNPFYREKSIKPSRDLSVSLMCNIESKNQISALKMIETLRNSKNQSSSLREMKLRISRKIQSFKSLTKIHEQQSEYFTKKIGISEGQQKRLQKIQLMEMNSVKKEIFHLRDEIQNKFEKTK